MSTSLDSDSSQEKPGPIQPRTWLKIATFAAASAVAGGLAAAWWHRKTLARLRESEAISKNPDFSMCDDEPGDGA
jgi:hypothetical protein